MGQMGEAEYMLYRFDVETVEAVVRWAQEVCLRARAVRTQSAELRRDAKVVRQVAEDTREALVRDRRLGSRPSPSPGSSRDSTYQWTQQGARVLRVK